MDSVLALDVLKKHGKALLIEELETVLIPAVEKAVKDSPNPYDDMALIALKELVVKYAKEAIDKI